jgi:hypothetical protein
LARANEVISEELRRLPNFTGGEKAEGIDTIRRVGGQIDQKSNGRQASAISRAWACGCPEDPEDPVARISLFCRETLMQLTHISY